MPDCFANQLYPDSVDDIAEILEAALEHVPLLGEAGVSRFVNGPIPYSPDVAPLCGPAFGLPNFCHACCYEIEGEGATDFLNKVFCGAMPSVGA